MFLLAQMFSHESIQTSPERRPRGIDIGIQTTPSLGRSVQTIEQQTTPIVKRSSSSSSCQTTPVAVPIRHSNRQQTSPIIERTSSKIIIEEQQEATPLHTKAIVHLRRNVRFQFTPSTDARLAAKEKLEEDQRVLKQEIIINNDIPNHIPTDNEREEDTEDEIDKAKKKISTSRKKKHVQPKKNVGDSSEETSPIQHEPEKMTNDNEETKSDSVVIPITRQTRTRALKRPSRPEKKSLSEPEIIISTEPSPPAKRANRKRPNPKLSTAPPSEITSPTEPIVKRAKTTKTIETKEPIRG